MTIAFEPKATPTAAGERAPAPEAAWSIDQLCVDTIRTLAMDAVQKAKSGHPGTPMGLAPVVYTLWQEALRYDPAHPLWPDRDRFGHCQVGGLCPERVRWAKLAG